MWLGVAQRRLRQPARAQRLKHQPRQNLTPKSTPKSPRAAPAARACLASSTSTAHVSAREGAVGRLGATEGESSETRERPERQRGPRPLAARARALRCSSRALYYFPSVTPLSTTLHAHAHTRTHTTPTKKHTAFLQRDFSLAPNPGRWNRKYGTLYLDQPIGTGFSVTGAISDWTAKLLALCCATVWAAHCTVPCTACRLLPACCWPPQLPPGAACCAIHTSASPTRSAPTQTTTAHSIQTTPHSNKTKKAPRQSRATR